MKRAELQGSVRKSTLFLQRTDLICYLFLIFLTGCLAGWIYEEIFYWITEGMLRNRGVLYGPWLPVYGAGTLGIYAVKPLKKRPVVLFLLCALVTGVVEYIVGYIGIRFLDMRLWDYRGLFLNLNGIICFRSVVSFAVMGFIFLYLLEPMLKRITEKAGRRVIYAVCVGLAVLLLTDCVLSAMFRTPITY